VKLLLHIIANSPRDTQLKADRPSPTIVTRGWRGAVAVTVAIAIAITIAIPIKVASWTVSWRISRRRRSPILIRVMILWRGTVPIRIHRLSRIAMGRGRALRVAWSRMVSNRILS
jgi:hypothetical protein